MRLDVFIKAPGPFPPSCLAFLLLSVLWVQDVHRWKACPSPWDDDTLFTSGLKVETMVSMVSGVQTPAGVWLALRVGCFAREESKRQMWGAEPLHGSPPRAAGMSLAVALVNALAKIGVCSPFQNKLCLASHCQHKTRAYLLC